MKQKRNKFQKSSNADHKVFDKDKPKKSFDKAKPENSKIIFDDDGNQQKPTKKKNANRHRSTESFNQTDDVASRWYEEVISLKLHNASSFLMEYVLLFFSP